MVGSNLLGFLSELRDNAKNQPPAEEVCRSVELLAPGWLSEEGHLSGVQKTLTSIMKPWEQLTGLYQSWSLYSPEIYRDVCFPAVEFRWDDSGPFLDLSTLTAMDSWQAVTMELAVRNYLAAQPSLVLLSDNEPSDPNHYFRIGMFRVRRFESQLEVDLPPGESRVEWRTTIQNRVNEAGSTMKFYLSWRQRVFAERHPDRPPATQITLLMRRYHIRPPELTPPYWDGPFVNPVARLRPRPRQSLTSAPLEPYNPVTERFEAP
jgi:hypothetical protein